MKGMDEVYSLFHPASKTGAEMREFADQLRATREAKGISLSDISSKTKIQLKYLQAMEEGDFSFLPPPYVRAFIRDFAKALHLDPDETLRKFDNAVSTVEGGAESDRAEKKPSQPAPRMDEDIVQPPRGIIRSLWLSFRDYLKQEHTRKKLISVTSVVVLLVALFLVAKLIRNSSNDSTAEIPFDQILKEKEPTSSGHADSVRAATTGHLSGAIGDSLVLEARTTERVWVRMLIDNHPGEEYIFPPNSRRIWKAREKFQVTLGDAGGISFKLNGKDLGTLGKLGAVVRDVTIAHDGIHR